MRRQAFDVLVVGPAERDYLFVTKGETLVYGETVSASEVPVTLAGSGANVAVSLARLGLKVGLVAAVGRDPRGDEVLGELAREGVETSLVTRVSLVATGLTVTVYPRVGDAPPFGVPLGSAPRILQSAPLVLRYGGAADLVEITEEVQKMLHTTQWVYLAGYSAAWERPVGLLLETLEDEETRLAWHPGRSFLSDNREFFSALLKRSHVLFVDVLEARALASHPLVSLGPSSGPGSVSEGRHEELEAALANRGVRVSVLMLEDAEAHARAGNVHVCARSPGVMLPRDPRGSADAFRSAFLAGYVYAENDPGVALQWGLLNAESVGGSHTTQQGLLTRSVLEERLRRQRIAVERATVEA